MVDDGLGLPAETQGIPLRGHEALPDGIDGEQETLQGHCSQQKRPLRSDKAGCCGFVAPYGEPNFGYGPDFSPSPGNKDARVSADDKAKAISKFPRDNEKGRARVDEELDFFTQSGRTGQTSRNPEVSHPALTLTERE